MSTKQIIRSTGAVLLRRMKPKLLARQWLPAQFLGTVSAAPATATPRPSIIENMVVDGEIRPDVYPVRQESFARTLWTALYKYGQDLALVEIETGRRVTYADLLSEASGVASRLLSVGCQSQDVVAIFSSNSITWIVVYLAVCRIGAIPATVNAMLTPGELRHQLETCEAKFVFTSPALVNTAMEATMDNAAIKKLLLCGASHPGCEDIGPESRGNLPTLPPIESLEHQSPDDASGIYFSSGTTGVQKAILITNRNIQYQYSVALDPMIGGYANGGPMVSFAPYSHVTGGNAALMGLASRMPDFILARFDPDKYLRALDEFQVEHAIVVPPIVVMMAKSPLGLKYKLNSLRCLMVAGGPLSIDVEELFVKRFPQIVIRHVYGLTETCGVCAMTPHRNNEKFKFKPGSVGPPFQYVSMKVVDMATGKSLDAGQNGEICVKSPMVFPKYINNPQATAETIDKDGWLHTGDVGYYDEDGYFYIVDRLKELIKYKAYQVPPVELENILLSHPDVADAGVIGLPDAEAGELPLAWVVKKPNSTVTETEIQQFVDGKVAAFKRLRGGVKFVAAIPKTPSGKVLRRAMKETLLAGKL